MKLEPQDDGYETSGDLMLPASNPNIKCDKMEDPYSFIDEDPIPMIQHQPQHHLHQPQQQQQHPQQQQHHPMPQMQHMSMGMMQQQQHHQQQMQQLQQQHQQQQQQPPPQPPMHHIPPPGPKKRGRKKKIKPEDGEFNPDVNSVALNGGIPRPIKERKKHDRFNGMPEEEVSKRTLPDHLTPNLDIIIIGINPGLFAAYKGHHYAGPGNHFWKCLYLSGLTPQQMCADEDYKLLQVGIGFTNMVARATKGSADLTRKEIKEGSQILLEKLRKFKPKIAVFNGKLIYEVFSGKKDFKFGRQPDCIDGTSTHMWVMPSSSARCAQLPRAADKVPFYAALKKFRDYLNGLVTQIDESELVFSEPRVKSCYEAEPGSGDMTDISGNPVIKAEDGSILPSKKKRGRPKKIKVEGEEPTKASTTPRKSPSTQAQQHANCDFPKKKRGRPKKVKVEDAADAGSLVVDTNTSTNLSKCFSSPSPIQSPTNFYHMGPALTPPNSASNLYPPQTYSQSPRPQYNTQSPRPQPFGSTHSQSPRPQSQPFTHSDLSSEISAAISSEQLGSPASPSLGPPDFDPPTSMTEEAECRLASPAPSTNGEPHPHQSQHQPQQHHYPYHPYADHQQQQQQQQPQPPPPQQQQSQHDQQHFATPRQPQDMATKSLSGLESLVDQIPSITDGDPPMATDPTEYSSQFGNYRGAVSPASYNYSPGAPTSSYPIYPTPTWSTPYEPVPLGYPQLSPYAQTYHPPGLHVPSPNYPYYGYPQPAHPPPGYPPYLGGF